MTGETSDRVLRLGLLSWYRVPDFWLSRPKVRSRSRTDPGPSCGPDLKESVRNDKESAL